MEPISNIRVVCKDCGINKTSKEKLDALKVGMFVKTIDNNERFWVKIVEIVLKDDTLKVKVDNDLLNKHDFKCGDIITITKDSIIEIIFEN
jgi:hypothetical protein